jgi:hypothetical protein
MRIYLFYEGQFGEFIRYQTKNNLADAIRTAKIKSKQMKRRFKVTNEQGALLNLIS